MPRGDLLALSADDLIRFSNPGNVKKASRELEEGLSCTLEELPDGTLTAQWPDAQCRIAAKLTLARAACTCPATGVCRHLIRTVLAYQRQQTASEAGPKQATQGPWDPGTIDDSLLAPHFQGRLSSIRKQFQSGVLVELLRGERPSAYFLQQNILTRFLIPGDPRYASCACGKPAPCNHVAQAIWAFRLLPADQQAGLISSTPAPAIPGELLDETERLMADLCDMGIGGITAGWREAMQRLSRRCDAVGLGWLADIAEELLEQHDRYLAQDARFSPEEVMDLAGELLVRADAIGSGTAALPQIMIRGSGFDRAGTLGRSTLVGLGCGAQVYPRHTRLTVYLQDQNSGSLMTISEVVPDNREGGEGPQRALPNLAQRRIQAFKGTVLPWNQAGISKLLIEGGTRSAQGHYRPSTRPTSVLPQKFDWETLRPPILVDDFADLEARLALTPPSSLRARRDGEDFRVCKVSGARDATFDVRTQSILAQVADAQGRTMLLSLPYTSRGQSGAEATLQALRQRGERLCFVSGRVRRRGDWIIEPVCLLFQDEGRRVPLQPWLEQTAEDAGSDHPASLGGSSGDPLAGFLDRLRRELEDLLVLGLARSDERTARAWQDLAEHGAGLGFTRLLAPLRSLAGELARKPHSRHWDWHLAAQQMTRLLSWLRMSQDV